MVHPGLGVLSPRSSSLISFYTRARVRLPRAQIWDLLLGCVCVCVHASCLCVCFVYACMRVCLVYAWQALQQRHHIPSPESASDHVIAFSKSVGLSERQRFGHKSGVSVVVLQLSDGVRYPLPCGLW